jgi:hypothetical protein
MVASIPEALATWSAYYSDHTAVSAGLRFLHLAGVTIGGGTALAADRLALKAGVDASRRERLLATLAEAHRVVVPSLVVVGIIGALMFAADAETFLGSRTFAAKMAVVAVLGANGEALRRTERAIRQSASETAWRTLRGSAAISTVLWLLTLLLGVMLGFAA